MPKKLNDNENVSKFDFALTIYVDFTTNQLSCTIDASLDLFELHTIENIGQRFHSMLQSLFNTKDVQMNKSIYEVSLILPDERLLMQTMNNTEMLFLSVSCIHYEFVSQAMKHSQKLAVELDDQCLTYSELLHYAQTLSFHVLNEHRIISGDVICQCVERSLSMVS
jgi:non-ribosomal peptide synthetase component F